MPTDELLLRIERLETMNRWTRAIALLAIILLPTVLLRGSDRKEAATVQKELRVNRLLLVDEHGELRGAFGFTPTGTYLELMDENGQLRGAFALAPAANRCQVGRAVPLRQPGNTLRQRRLD